MDIINSQLFDTMGKLISCIVTTIMFFRYFDARYTRRINKKTGYGAAKIVCCMLNLFVYSLNIPLANVVFWIAAILLISWQLYDKKRMNRAKYYLVNIAYFFAYSICEAIGCVIISSGIQLLNTTQNASVIGFVYTLGGSATAIILHYLVLQRLFVHEKMKRISPTQYIMYAMITAYVLVNIGSILFLLQHKLEDKDYLFLLLDAVLVIGLNLYLFYLLDILAENRDLKYKVALYERQSQGNYEYYTKQIENNKKALRVIHDVRKHIRVLEELKQSQISTQLQGYTDSFEEMIKPLIIKQYSDNAILNIIINDKADYCERNAIRFEVDIQPVYLDFMKPIDITTIFGNLMDNAVEACEKAKDKILHLIIYPFNGMIYVQLSNTYQGSVHWDLHGRPLSMKGEQHGIGLENVEKVLKEYNGTIQYEASEKMFTVELMFSNNM